MTPSCPSSDALCCVVVHHGTDCGIRTPGMPAALCQRQGLTGKGRPTTHSGISERHHTDGSTRQQYMGAYPGDITVTASADLSLTRLYPSRPSATPRVTVAGLTLPRCTALACPPRRVHATTATPLHAMRPCHRRASPHCGPRAATPAQAIYAPDRDSPSRPSRPSRGCCRPPQGRPGRGEDCSWKDSPVPHRGRSQPPHCRTRAYCRHDAAAGGQDAAASHTVRTSPATSGTARHPATVSHRGCARLPTPKRGASPRLRTRPVAFPPQGPTHPSLRRAR